MPSRGRGERGCRARGISSGGWGAGSWLEEIINHQSSNHQSKCRCAEVRKGWRRWVGAASWREGMRASACTRKLRRIAASLKSVGSSGGSGFSSNRFPALASRMFPRIFLQVPQDTALPEGNRSGGTCQRGPCGPGRAARQVVRPTSRGSGPGPLGSNAQNSGVRGGAPLGRSRCGSFAGLARPPLLGAWSPRHLFALLSLHEGRSGGASHSVPKP